MDENIQQWPGGDYQNVALLCVPDSKLESWFGRSLITGVEEGLGPWKACGGALPSGVLVEFVRYELSSAPLEYELRCQLYVDREQVLSEVIGMLALNPSEVMWVNR